MSVSEGYGEKSTVVASQSEQLSSPMESILHWEQGRSWAPSDTSNLSEVKQKRTEENLFENVIA